MLQYTNTKRKALAAARQMRAKEHYVSECGGNKQILETMHATQHAKVRGDVFVDNTGKENFTSLLLLRRRAGDLSNKYHT